MSCAVAHSPWPTRMNRGHIIHIFQGHLPGHRIVVAISWVVHWALHPLNRGSQILDPVGAQSERVDEHRHAGIISDDILTRETA